MKRVVDSLACRWPIHLRVVEIDSDAELVERYGLEVPVLTVNGRKAFMYRCTTLELEQRLAQEAPFLQSTKARRPWWMTAMALYCAGAFVFLAWRDLFLPHVRDVEVWFGFEVRGQAALWSAPLHWLMFLAGAWAFWREHEWATRCAIGYSFYIALSHLIWNVVSPNGWGEWAALWQFALFSLPGFALIRLSGQSAK